MTLFLKWNLRRFNRQGSLENLTKSRSSQFIRTLVAELVRVRFFVENRPKSHDFGYEFGTTEIPKDQEQTTKSNRKPACSFLPTAYSLQPYRNPRLGGRFPVLDEKVHFPRESQHPWIIHRRSGVAAVRDFVHCQRCRRQ